MARETKAIIAGFFLSLALILFALSPAAAATDSLLETAKDSAAKHQNRADEALLSNIKQYCAANLGRGYFLKVQKTYNGGYLFICSQVGDENGKDISYRSLAGRN
ncbi:MAG: hypothetical protein M0Z61_13030 [Nitrospiraceae bacterium]|nr:hypothetical protein [Nitrospiraceae bacterium]